MYLNRLPSNYPKDENSPNLTRDSQTPSIFHRFLLPPNLHKHRYKDAYIEALKTKLENVKKDILIV